MKKLQRRCGECGNKDFVLKNVKNNFKIAWRDFPVTFLTTDLELWTCSACGNYGIGNGDSVSIDAALDQSVRSQAAQFIDIIRSKARVKSSELARCMGITPQHLSKIHSGKERPSYHLWNLLKMTAIDPVNTMKKMDPNLDIVKEKILLRA